MVLQRDWNMTLFLKGFTVLLIITLSATSASSDVPDLNLTLSGNCELNLTAECAMDFLDRILNISAEELHQEMVEGYLNTITTLMTSVMYTVTDEDVLIRFGDSVLNVNEKLASTLLRKTETFNLTSIFLQMLEVQVFQVGPAGADPYLSEVLQLQMSNVTMDIDLSEILNENNGSAAVGLISYSNMAEIFNLGLFNTSADKWNILVSSVVSAVLPKTSNTQLTRAANFTFKHDIEFSITYPLYCVYWNSSRWVESGCDVTRINTTHTECSCSHLSTFALILQINLLQSYITIDNPDLDKFTIAFLILSFVVGMFFLSLSILTFAVCRDNTALVNLCINIWLFDLIQIVSFFSGYYIHWHKILAAVLRAGEHLLQLSIFMWMFLEVVVLYIFVKNLSKIRLNKTKVLNWKWLVLIGYSIPLVFVVLTAALAPCAYIDVPCWRYISILKFTFYGPILLLSIINGTIFIVVIVHLIATLIRLRNANIRMNNTVDKKLMISVVLKSLAQFFIIIFPMIPFMMSFFSVINNKNVMDFWLFILVVQFFFYLQGTFIFLVHCVFNQKVREKYKQILGACCRRNTPNIRTDVQDVQQTVRTSVNSFLEKLGRFVKRK